MPPFRGESPYPQSHNLVTKNLTLRYHTVTTHRLIKCNTWRCGGAWEKSISWNRNCLISS